LLEQSPLSLAIGSSFIINSMARSKKTHREVAAFDAKKKSAIKKRYSGGVTWSAFSAAATRGTGANMIMYGLRNNIQSSKYKLVLDNL
jgi:hypothetical protein